MIVIVLKRSNIYFPDGVEFPDGVTDSDGVEMTIRKCSPLRRQLHSTCTMASPPQMLGYGTNGETCYCNEDGCNSSKQKAKIRNVAANIISSVVNTIFMTVCAVYLL